MITDKTKPHESICPGQKVYEDTTSQPPIFRGFSRRRELLRIRQSHERRFHRSPSIERLEDRQLLAGSNLFAQYNGLLDPADDVEHLDLAVAPQELALMRGRAYLGFHLQARDGNRFDPAVVNIYREDGTPVRPTFARSDLHPTTDSYVMAMLEAGNYRVDVGGQVDGRSQFVLDVFLVGDVDGNHTVDRHDIAAIRGMYGARQGSAEYLVSADANLDGRINVYDVLLTQRNETYSRGAAPAGVAALMAHAEPISESAPAAESEPQDPPAWGGVYDRAAAVTPQAGYKADAPMQFFESEIGWVQPLSSSVASEGGVHTVPGDPGTTGIVVVDWFYREAAYGNDLVLYTVDNDEGDIWIADLQEPEGGYYVYPDQDNDGDQDFDEADQMLYHTAAANREEGCLDALDDPGHHYEVPSDSPLMVELDAGTKFAFYLVSVAEGVFRGFGRFGQARFTGRASYGTVG